MALLAVDNVSKRYGGLLAINKVSLSVEEGSVSALIGPNGAGKSTLFNIISCLEKSTAGSISLKDHDITNYLPYQVVALGVARTFQNLCVFENMDVIENVMTGLHLHTRSNILSAGLKIPSLRRQEKETISSAEEILDFLGLSKKARLRANELPYGEQRLLEIARALATHPILLLLDEPAAGLNSKETEILAAKILEIKKSGVTVFLVEHDMNLVMTISDHITVLNYGQILATGTPLEIRNHPEVIKSYLGGKSS
jgi:branched-chain amino acid transport system ATP-binding protein